MDISQWLPIRMITAIVAMAVISQTVCAYITIDGESVHVETDGYAVQFDKGVLTHIYNKRTGETYTIPESPIIEGQTGILRWPPNPIWVKHSAVEARNTGPNSATLEFSQNASSIVLTIEVEPITGDLFIGGYGEVDTGGVYGFQWGCDNIDINNVDLILPAHGGQVITASSPFESKRYTYPELWEAQLVIGQGEQGGFFVRGTDKTFQAKRFNCEKNSKELTLGFQTHNQAPWDALHTAQSVVWRFNTYAGDYRVPAQIYRDWMEEAFEPWRLSDVAPWVEDIGLVVTSGVSRTRLERLFRLAEHVDPSKTLIYVVSWRQDRHDVNYPEYTPREGFADYITALHDLGYRIMLHANMVGLSPYHPLYAEFQQYQFAVLGIMGVLSVGGGVKQAIRNVMLSSITRVLSSETSLFHGFKSVGRIPR